jgi:hypothetical protein
MVPEDVHDDDDILIPKKATTDANLHGLDNILSPKAPGTDTNMEPEEIKEYVPPNLKFNFDNNACSLHLSTFTIQA